MRIDILTLFPTMFFSALQESILKRAQQRGLLTLVIHHIRDYALDRHQMTDDIPYGGGEGMILKPEPIFRAVRSVLGDAAAPVILLTPQGRPLNHTVVEELAQHPRLLLICGHYEGIDERVRQHIVTDEISIGDYVLTGGELAAMVLVDAVARFVPGVLGAAEGARNDSFADGLLEGPQYTRPPVLEGRAVPDVLLSGNHALIARWKRARALQRTLERRPDLLAAAALTDADVDMLQQFGRTLGEPDVMV
ncbi:MAG TPA: tRNA (guanosine(37)-N1)-methyltransferase TrmD [Anaerolineae bacterium]|nr:tRNA (guanosine(37)-N1)-methyltransferase TrmD [Anaerolineae bacterium]HQI84497.1 tRNA (guanosine(37)-N1)-methyltransferase TrmD [Anaerolineae bacterium]